MSLLNLSASPCRELPFIAGSHFGYPVQPLRSITQIPNPSRNFSSALFTGTVPHTRGPFCSGSVCPSLRGRLDGACLSRPLARCNVSFYRGLFSEAGLSLFFLFARVRRHGRLVRFSSAQFPSSWAMSSMGFRGMALRPVEPGSSCPARTFLIVNAALSRRLLPPVAPFLPLFGLDEPPSPSTREPRFFRSFQGCD